MLATFSESKSAVIPGMKQLAKTLYGFVFLWTPPEPNEKKQVPVIVKRSWRNKFDSVASFDDPYREVHVMRQLTGHPHVITFFDARVNVPLKQLDLYMEYASGGDMFGKVETTKTGFPEPQAKAYLRQILQGIEYLHVKKNMSHLDLSLENLLVIPDSKIPLVQERVVLTDFGSTVTNADNFRFISALRPGKAHYQAPEMHHQDAVALNETQTTTIPSTTAVDIFAFGVIMFEMLVAHPPFQVATDRRYDIIRKKGVGRLLPAAKDTVPYLPPHHATQEAIDIMDWCLMPDPNDRPSVSQLLHLKYFAAPAAVESSSVPTTTASTSLSKSSDVAV